MKAIDYPKYEQFAVSLAQHAGKILLDYRGKAAIVVQKGKALDFAPEADIASERYIRSEIGKMFPSHGVMGEEEGFTNKDNEYLWVIDPLDGTLEYKRGSSSFDVHIALEYKGELIAGCVYKPLTEEIFSVAKGYGVKENEQTVRVSEIYRLNNSILYMMLPRSSNTSEEIHRSVRILEIAASQIGLIRDAWEVGLALANVASGSTDAFLLVKQDPKWWDVAPGILLVEEAGGKVSDMYGGPIINRDLSKGLVATNGQLHDKILQIVKNGINQ